ncbi:hypothetical protein [Hydrocarboniphaga sp.]|uniref:hypothetical protein n=1 Tax=Hydrocarboniphaga sp. TaxID=2033016 RepID=UPI003D109DCF
MALSKTSKTGLALGALLPVLASLYGEMQQQSQQREQQQAARSELIKHQRAEAVSRDLDTAKSLLNQIASESENSLCEHFYIASELVRLGGYSRATRRALISALRYQPEGEGADTQPRICECRGTLAQMRSSWRPTLGSTSSPAVIEEMNRGLDQAEALCASPEQVAMAVPPPPPPPAAMPAPLPPEPVIVGSAPPPAPVQAVPSPPPPENALPARCRQAPTPPAVPVRVYLQIADDSQREAAQQLAQQLNLHGYAAAGVEKVGETASPKRAQLRYVYPEDRDEAERLLANLLGCQARFALQPPMTQFRQRTPRYSFELWFPRLAAVAPENAP